MRNGNFDEAMKWVKEHETKLNKMDSDIEFVLHKLTVFIIYIYIYSI